MTSSGGDSNCDGDGDGDEEGDLGRERRREESKQASERASLRRVCLCARVVRCEGHDAQFPLIAYDLQCAS